MRAPDAIERSQKKIYLSIKSELDLFEKKKKKELLSYEKAFRASLARSPKPARKNELLYAIRQANLVLVGDFHPFRQSQKGFLRLVEECAPKAKRPVLALECVQQAHQAAVNEFLAGFITIEELRDKIDFERYWPFSWENYREILLCAKRMKIPVIALNILERKRNPSMLRERDRAAAERTAAEIVAHPSSTVFLLYGELHLARRHLPADLRTLLGKKARLVVVHQNDPELYWKAPKQKNGQKPDLLKLASDEFCILNSVPWVKLRSYLDWLEGCPSSEEWEEGLDIVGTVHNYARLLADAVGLQVLLREDVEILGPEYFPANKFLGRSKTSRSVDKLRACHSEQFQRIGYLPESGTLLLPTVSTNSLSEAASFLLWHSMKGNESPNIKLTAQSWIAHFLVGYLGSKILNPKRKCNEVADLKEIQQQLKGGRESGKQKVVGRALTLLKPYIKNEKISARIGALRGSAELEACRLAGFVLGERLFLSVLMDPDLISFVRAWYQRSTTSSRMKILLTESAAKIRTISPARKRDRF